MRRIVLAGLLALPLAVPLAGCGPDWDTATEAPGTNAPLLDEGLEPTEEEQPVEEP